jgi:hypothetical protein
LATIGTELVEQVGGRLGKGASETSDGLKLLLRVEPDLRGIGPWCKIRHWAELLTCCRSFNYGDGKGVRVSTFGLVSGLLLAAHCAAYKREQY